MDSLMNFLGLQNKQRVTLVTPLTY